MSRWSENADRSGAAKRLAASPPGTCATVRPDLPGLDGHELSTGRAAEVRAHVADCSDCAAAAAGHRAVRRTLAELGSTSVAPPDGLLPALLAAAAAPSARATAAVYGRGVVSGTRPGVAAASAGVGAFAAAGLGMLAWRALRSRRALAAESA
ncbi:MAG TPA: zf-HC2 domain-containing protein [Mycobacteriales bacterium]|nr:zf-HC2 domain-containing protein [Mycobacteriales bacterium]